MTPHYFKLQILKLEDLYKFKIAKFKFMHQFTQNKLPSRFRHYFSHPSDIHTVTLILRAIRQLKIFLFLVSLLLKLNGP